MLWSSKKKTQFEVHSIDSSSTIGGFREVLNFNRLLLKSIGSYVTTLNIKFSVTNSTWIAQY